MRILNSAETAARLPYPELAQTIAQVLRDNRKGLVTSPERQHIALAGGGTLLVMPGGDPQVTMTKLVTVHPDNPSQNLPTIQGQVIVMDTATGTNLGILEGRTLTARRTAALSLLAWQVLAPQQTENPSFLLVGAGAQAEGHLEALASVDNRPKQIFIVARSLESSGRLAQKATTMGLKAQAVGTTDLPGLLPDMDIVVTTTTSTSPVLPDDPGLLNPHCFLAGVGAFTPSMAEVGPAMTKACRLYADTVEGVRSEGGDFIQAGVDWQTVTSLEDALHGARPADTPNGGPVFFKSVGCALFDLAAAKLALGNGTHARK
ncbi:MAG: delta(1)-pyrroline-2-carboxylate reductase family protein [Desulfovibrio sp.]|uniref:delta(1)-pyrroline-2-carboxylate reductase family protein n=1 Tax=Desulfovibrio sp. 7SRBS1 TaxID=3378064 RepID=UPI003B4164C1